MTNRTTTKATAKSAAGKPKANLAPYDSSEYLKDDADMAALLDAALEDGHPGVIAHALGAIAKAKGMGKIAKDAGLGRESLYKALSDQGNPELATFMKVIQALGLQLHATPARRDS